MSSDVRKADASSPYGRTLKYSVDEKLAIINHAKSHGNRAAGREFNVAESSIREWRKNEVKLMNNKHSSAGGSSVGSASVHHNNNNNNHIKRGAIPVNSHQNHLIRPKEMSKTNEEFMRGLAQYATLQMLNIDLAHMAPLLQLHQQKVQAQQLPESSTASSVGTPSSEGYSPPPPTSPISGSITSGSSRRKPKCPQKIAVEQRDSD